MNVPYYWEYYHGCELLLNTLEFNIQSWDIVDQTLDVNVLYLLNSKDKHAVTCINTKPNTIYEDIHRYRTIV